jgi:hypothetical protein
MLNSSENAAGPEIFPYGFEVMGGWKDRITHRRKSLVRFFCTDTRGRQVGHDAFRRVFDSFDLLIFVCSPWHRQRLALEQQEELAHEDQAQVAEILRATGSL